MKRDILLATIIGFLIAFLIVAVKLTGNIEKLNTVPYLKFTLVAFPLLSAIGMKIAMALAAKIRVALQEAKFLLVGALNTFLDLAILNILIAATGIATGGGFSVFKGISFLCAVGNSYVWNKYWTFGAKGETRQGISQKGKEFAQFFVVSGIGFFINVGSASFVVNIIGPQFGISASTWPTVGALVGTFLVLTWNFLGYKLIVFRR
ncbi:MAG TPA: GtrA family protein [Candidatus Paceibacterota bacterium]